MTNINDFGVNYLVQTLPFGGVKDSGSGRFAGPEGLRECCLLKSVTVDCFPFSTVIPEPLLYPVTRSGALFSKNLTTFTYSTSALGQLSGILGMIKALVYPDNEG
ncbi:unnamed protein product [Discosporangium mesarthrocarpum]